MSLRSCPNYFPGESSDLQLNVLAQHSRKTNGQPSPRAVLPGGAGLPGKAAASWGSTTDGWRLGHGFLRKGEIPKRKKGVLNQGEVMLTAARLIADTGFWLGFIF